MHNESLAIWHTKRRQLYKYLQCLGIDMFQTSFKGALIHNVPSVHHSSRTLRYSCLASGQWEGPTCERTRCPTHDVIYMGLYSCTDGYYVDSQCTLKCPGPNRVRTLMMTSWHQNIITVETLYNTINFCWNTHKRHSIARPKGRGMGCLLWVQRATYCVALSILSSIKYLL